VVVNKEPSAVNYEIFPNDLTKYFTTLLKTQAMSFMSILLVNFLVAMKWSISKRDKRATNEELEDITSMISL